MNKDLLKIIESELREIDLDLQYLDQRYAEKVMQKKELEQAKEELLSLINKEKGRNEK